MDRLFTRSLIESHEGRVPFLYLDSRGLCTAGCGEMLPNAEAAHALFGHDVTAHFEKVKAMAPGHLPAFYHYPGAPTLTSAQIDSTLDASLDRAIASAHKLIPNFDALPYKVAAVVVDCIFNMGEYGFSKFHNTIALIEKGDFHAVADALANSLWAREVPVRAKGDIALIRAAA